MDQIDMNEIAELRSAIQGLYRIFDRYPRPSKIEYCLCGCTKPEEVSPLLASPLHDLEFKNLENYSFSAMTTQGSVSDFKHFLPRLLEGIAQEPYGYNPEILFGKLEYGEWLTWNEEEILTIREYLVALWRVGLQAYPVAQTIPAFVDIEELLSSLATTGDRMEDYLAIWERTRVSAADQHLIQFVIMHGAEFAEGKSLHFGFWEKHRKQSEELRRWLLKSEILNRVVESKQLLEIDGYEHLFGPALQVLQAESIANNS